MQEQKEIYEASTVYAVTWHKQMTWGLPKQYLTIVGIGSILAINISIILGIFLIVTGVITGIIKARYDPDFADIWLMLVVNFPKTKTVFKKGNKYVA